LEDQERLTRDLLGAIKNADEEALVNIIRAGEKNLETIGVVSSSAKQLIRDIEKAGGAAKICGAGGASKGSGIILAYNSNKKVLELLAKTKKMPYYTVVLGGEGLKIE
jgi:mevalonate kinase